MFDLNSIATSRQHEENAHKLNLLKQIKITLESMMFDRAGQSFNNNAWHKFNAINTIFCRHVLAILEDGLIQSSSLHHVNSNVTMLSMSSSSNSLESSPDSLQSQNTSRKTTQSSMVSRGQLPMGDFTLWSFVMLVLNENSNLKSTNSNEINKLDDTEYLAKRDFKFIYNQITQQQNESGNNQETSGSNLAIEWISNSLRQRCILTQLKYLLLLNNDDDISLKQQFYAPNAFILDRSFVNDFLIFIRAFEQNDFTIMNRVKRNFFQAKATTIPNTTTTTSSSSSSSPQTNELIIATNTASSQVTLRNKYPISRHKKQTSADLTMLIKQQQQNLLFSPNNEPSQLRNMTRISIYSSISDMNNENSSSFVNNNNSNINGSASSLALDDVNSSSSILIEQKINELNANVAKKVAASHQGHRRMHSFPNIQINHLKKHNSMIANSPRASFIENMDTSENKVQDPKENDSKNITFDEKYNEESSAIDKERLPTIIINDDECSSETAMLESNNQIESNSFNVELSDLLEKTTVFDFIHAIQIQSECSTLDKENSHFIMADLTIASNEIIKTNELLFDEEQFMNSNKNKLDPSFKPPIRPFSHSIKIRNHLDEKYLSAGQQDSFEAYSSSSFTSSTVHNSPHQVLFIIDENKLATNDNSLSYSPNFSENLSLDDSNTTSTRAKREKWQKSNQLFNQSVESSSPSSSYINQLKQSSVVQSSFEQRNGFNSEMVNEELTSQSLTQSLDSHQISESSLVSRSSLRNQTVITEDGFEILPKVESKKSSYKDTYQRVRKFSWEEINDEDNAESLAKRLVQNTFDINMEIIKNKLKNNIYLKFVRQLEAKILNNNKKKQIPQKDEKFFVYWHLMPNLKNYEFFIQYLEYMEYMQTYYELRNSGKLKRPTNTSALAIPSSSLKQVINSSISPSSMYLSHFLASSSSASNQQEAQKTNAKPAMRSSLFRSSKSITSPSKTSIFSSSSSKTTAPVSRLSTRVKSSALAAALTVSLLHMHRENELSTVASGVDFDLVSIDSISAKNLNLTTTNPTLPSSINNDATNKLIRQLSTNFDSFSLTSSINITNNANNNFSISPASSQSLVINSYKNLNSRIIGDETWAPVREQLILNCTKRLKRMDQMELQHFRCADCGIQVRVDKIKTFYYCEYFSKYFCRCCHTNQQSYIPAYIVNLLDFRVSYEVSKKAKNFLEKIYNEPLITLESLNPSLFQSTNSIFSKVKKARFKLNNSRSYINSCRFASGLKEKAYAQFDDFFINDQHVYSIEILFKIKKTNFFDQLRNMVNSIIDHIKSCEICSQQGYICGICSKKDLLYPFDFEKVEKCPNCLACYHKQCFISPESCPRCERKRNRKISSSNLSTSDSITHLMSNGSTGNSAQTSIATAN